LSFCGCREARHKVRLLLPLFSCGTVKFSVFQTVRNASQGMQRTQHAVTTSARAGRTRAPRPLTLCSRRISRATLTRRVPGAPFPDHAKITIQGGVRSGCKGELGHLLWGCSMNFTFAANRPSRILRAACRGDQALHEASDQYRF